MTDVVSFRATDDEVALIERVRRQHGLATRAEAIRLLLQQAGAGQPRFSETGLGRFRLPKQFRSDRTLSSAEIDSMLYDDPRDG